MVQKDKGKKQEESQRPWGKTVKQFSNKKDRAAVRDALAHEEYDEIPNKRRMREEDPRDWD